LLTNAACSLIQHGLEFACSLTDSFLGGGHGFTNALNTISDPRRREGRRFDLPHLLLFSLLAIISGANSYRSITRFMHVRLEWFRSLTGIDWPTAPNHTGLRKCFLKLDDNAIECALRQHATDSTHSAQIAIDRRQAIGMLADSVASDNVTATCG
jgi:hypothetical protein